MSFHCFLAPIVAIATEHSGPSLIVNSARVMCLLALFCWCVFFVVGGLFCLWFCFVLCLLKSECF